MPDSRGGRRRGWPRSVPAQWSAPARRWVPAMRDLPVLRGILPLDRSRIWPDALAGVTLAALGVPEVLGYAKIAGMPLVTGLYTMLLPMAVFAVLGSSRHLVVAADSATAALLAAALTGMAVAGATSFAQSSSRAASLRRPRGHTRSTSTRLPSRGSGAS